ncbi:hypothetical protein M33023_01260 [Candidatus Phytoplasma asteris]|uniref:Uncharacterized protein n=3 Tax=16SrI (Aster yellows group) TaxID=3042590 RepID=Q2NK12_AYWBP|nr:MULTISPECIES: hypothetical protein [16SrI (Aster yellows group)]ABC65231.1 hypothetical protein AYWB_114 [Aster yellows witches'-broom phytoplasma AYWB]PEH36414.1 hypothetical protein BBA70_00560 [New Jersey aster yellows phytoplasma]
MNYTVFFVTICTFIVLSTLFLADSNDSFSLGNSFSEQKQRRKVKGEQFFLNCFLTVLTMAFFGLSLWCQQ